MAQITALLELRLSGQNNDPFAYKSLPKSGRTYELKTGANKNKEGGGGTSKDVPESLNSVY